MDGIQIQGRPILVSGFPMFEVRIEGVAAQGRAIVKRFWSRAYAKQWIMKVYPELAASLWETL